ncbi:MAG: type II toxin-antitoxin system PemK/MazF family toxin [Cyanobium sp.]
MRRGEIWVARLNPNPGAGGGKLRPVGSRLAAAFTRAGLATGVVVPLSSHAGRGARALRVPIRARDRLLCDSFALADQPRSLDRSRLGDGPLTTLSREELAELERALLGMLGIGLA